MKQLFLTIIIAVVTVLTVNAETERTALMYACSRETPEQIKALLESGTDINAVTPQKHQTALMYAATQHPVPGPIITLLLENGAEIDMADAEGNTALLLSCRNITEANRAARKEAALTLLKNGASVNCTNDQGITPLITAVQAMDAEFVVELLRNGAEIKVRDFAGETPLTYALRDGRNRNNVRLLLKHGADPNTRNYQNIPAIMLVNNVEDARQMVAYGAAPDSAGMTSQLLRTWASWGDPALVAALLKKHRQITPETLNAALESTNRETFKVLLTEYQKTHRLTLKEKLHYAVLTDDQNAIASLLEQGIKKADASQLLLMLCRQPNPNPDLIVTLLQHNADVNAVDDQGNTPLMLAARQPQSGEIAGLLLKRKAAVNQTNKEGRTALHMLCVQDAHNCPTEKILTWLEILRHQQPDVNAVDANGATPLLLALGHELPEPIIRSLLAMGADVNHASASGVTPLMLTARHYPAEMVNHLLLQGAKINAADQGGWTALFYAAEYWPSAEGDLLRPEPQRRTRTAPAATIKLLLERGAKANVTDTAGNTPLFEASGWADPETLKLLLKNGGDINHADAWNRTAMQSALSRNQDLSSRKLLLESGAKPDTTMKAGEAAAPNHKLLADGVISVEKTAINPGDNGWLEPPRALTSQYTRPHESEILRQENNIRPTVNVVLKQPAENADSFSQSSRTEGIVTLKKIREKLQFKTPEEEAAVMRQACTEALRHNRQNVVKWFYENGVKPLDTDWIAAVYNENHPEVVEYCLALPPASVGRTGEPNNGLDALHFVTSAAIAKFLMKQGLEPNKLATTAPFRTALADIILNPANQRMRWRQAEIAEALLQNGAEAEAQDETGRPLLIAAVMPDANTAPNEKLVRILLKYVKNVNAIDRSGHTALAWAVKNNHPVIVEMLLARGALPRTAMAYYNQATPYIQHCLNDNTPAKKRGRH